MHRHHSLKRPVLDGHIEGAGVHEGYGRRMSLEPPLCSLKHERGKVHAGQRCSWKGRPNCLERMTWAAAEFEDIRRALSPQ